MKRLFWNQLLYLWQIIRFRFICWLSLICFSIIFLSAQLINSPHTSIFNLFFADTSQDTSFNFILWLVYFLIPLLIVLNSFKLLWQTTIMHLRGLQIPPKNFTVVTMLLMGVIAFVYVFVTLLVMLLVTALFKLPSLSFFNLTDWQAIPLLFINNFLGIYLTLLLQGTIGKFNSALGLIIPASLLIMTSLLKWQVNPLNCLIIMRFNFPGFLLLLLATLIMVIVYGIIDHFFSVD